MKLVQVLPIALSAVVYFATPSQAATDVICDFSGDCKVTTHDDRPEGTIYVPASDLPLSGTLSPEARQFLIDGQKHPLIPRGAPVAITTEKEFAASIDKSRAQLDTVFAKVVADASKDFPVKITPATIGGVPVEEFEAAGGLDPANKNRVLINLHGGGFTTGAVTLGRVESIPVAGLTKTRVVSVNYRQGYEHKFPAASEDVAAVYQALLKQYPARNIGIYGCSAGGALTGQATAWIIDKGLPVPGAIGIFSSGAGKWDAKGDAAYFSAIGNGDPPPAEGKMAGPASRPPFGYLSQVKDDDYLAYPAKAPATLLAKFPPTLIITATRAFDMSAALDTHRVLTRAGVEASLQLFDGLGHCFIYFSRLPESKDANATIARFFDQHLGK